MPNEITSLQYKTTKQTIRNKYIKINLLNFNYLIMDSLEGNVIDGEIDINANSDIRRTCNVSFILTDSSFNVQAGGKVWLDKLFQIYIGIEDINSNEIIWNNMGIFLINKPSYKYDAQTKTMSFEGLDLMAKMTGIRNGYIMGISAEGYTLIPEGSNIRNAIISVLTECGFNNYYVSECINEDGSIQNVPYEMKFQQGTTWYNILDELRNIIPNYQIYFDVNGVFRYEKIPYTLDDPIRINDDIWKENVISENVDIDFESVKNVVEIYGRVHDVKSFSDSTVTTISSNTITPTWSGILGLNEFDMFGFEINSDLDTQNGIIISFLGNHNLVDSNGEAIKSLDKNKYYVISYQSDGTFLFLGGNQSYGIWEDNNPESPFYVESEIGRINISLYGNEYNNIISDELALQRAKYEIYKRCRLNDSLTLNTVPIYWADVNWKVSYTTFNNVTSEYMIQSMSIPLSVSGTQTIKLIKFYPLYPII